MALIAERSNRQRIPVAQGSACVVLLLFFDLRKPRSKA
jgi:hypothetical protein